MIDVKTEQLGIVFNADLMGTMEQVADIMYRSVQDNFIAGGRPNQWTPLQPLGESSHLYKTGNMFEHIGLKWDEGSATVYIDTTKVPYASIHNYGGTIKHPGSSKRQAFWINGDLVVTNFTKPHDINIPARPFMLFQDEDKRRIVELLSEAIFIQSERRAA